MVDIEAQPITGRNSVTLHNTQDEYLGRGSEPKSVVTAEVRRGPKVKEVSLIERSPALPQLWLQNWQMLHDAGLPVPPTVRRSDRDSYLITNLRAHGEEMYGKGTLVHLRDSLRWDEENTIQPIDLIFLRIMRTQETAVITKINELVKTANQHLIGLPTDDAMELLVSPDGSWRLVITDLAQAFQGTNLMEVADQNESSKVNFIRRLHKCIDQLERYVPHPPLRLKIIKAFGG